MSKHAIQQDIQHNQQGIAVAEISGGQVVFNVTYVTPSAIAPPPERLSDDAQTLGPNPYQGLEAFQEGDAERFFGRAQHVEQLWQQM